MAVITPFVVILLKLSNVIDSFLSYSIRFYFICSLFSVAIIHGPSVDYCKALLNCWETALRELHCHFFSLKTLIQIYGCQCLANVSKEKNVFIITI